MERSKETRLGRQTNFGHVLKYLLWFIAAAWVYTLSVIIDNYWSRYASYDSVTKAYQDALRSKESAFFSFLTNEEKTILTIAEGKYDEKSLKALEDEPFYLFLYYEGHTGKEPFFWSTNQVLPPSRSLGQLRSGQLYKYGNGHYEVLHKTLNIGGSTIEAIGLVLLHRQYFIDNARLQKGFPGFKNLEGSMLFSATPTQYAIRNVQGERLFYLQPAVTTPFRFFSWWSFVVQLAATVLLILLISFVASDILGKGEAMAGLGVFVAGFGLVWFAIRQYGVPINLDQFTWIEKSDSLSLPPTGLLNSLQNALFVFWLGWFLTSQSVHIGTLLSRINYKWKALLAVVFVGGALTTHFGIIESICSLYLSAAVAFDFNNFFSLNYTTIIAFVVMFLILMAHLMLVRFFVRSLLFITGGNIRFVLIALLGGGLLVLSVADFLEYKIQLLFSLLWLMGFAWYICRFPRPAFPVTSGRMVAWMLIYSISVGILLGQLSDERLRKRLYDIGKTLLMQNDQTSDYLVRFSSASIRRIDWANFIEQSADSLRSNALRDSLSVKYFGGYLDRFVTKFYFYDSEKAAINNPGEETYESLNTLFNASRKDDDYPWLATFEESFDRFGYIIRFDAYSGAVDAIRKGYVFVIVRSVVMRNALLAPELFRQLQDFAIDLPAGFSYAWYKSGRLVEQYRNYPFPSVVHEEGQKQQSVWNRESDGSFEIWMNAGSNTVLAISSARKIWLDFVSLVAYMFCSFLVIYMFLRMAGGLLQGEAFQLKIFKPMVFTIQAQIRLTIILILGISFLLVAYITINFFIGQFRKSNEERLAKLIESVSAELSQQLPAQSAQLADGVQHEIVSPALQEIAHRLDSDINFYNRSGKLVSSTQNVLFLKQVISEMMHPEAFYVLTKGSVHRHLMTETIGNLQYTSIYQPFRTSDGTLLGYLQVPYFASQNELKQEISNFVVILINIIAFVFLLSGGLAVLISGSITRSFAIIADKMNQLRLSEKNERIEWTAKNEIGNLVAQYNRMVDELEASAARLAQSERELAWREMARQVAHEIKNPLTPMKLNLQFLQKAIEENHPNVHEISMRVAGNLVSQIDHLSKIAFEFSQFANIGNARTTVFDLQGVLNDLVMLYDTQEHLHIQWVHPSEPVSINADKTQMNRLFTNLLQNAAEAGSGQKEVQISIIETIGSGKVLVEVKDNGPGIPQDVQSRIFMPNFTTKSSGTGLGLAISKAIVEKAGGHIWFQTSEHNGTSFFVELPLAE